MYDFSLSRLKLLKKKIKIGEKKQQTSTYIWLVRPKNKHPRTQIVLTISKRRRSLVALCQCSVGELRERHLPLSPCPNSSLPEGRSPIFVNGLDLVQEKLVSEGHRVIFGDILTLGWWIGGFGNILPYCHLHNNKTRCSLVPGLEGLWEGGKWACSISLSFALPSTCLLLSHFALDI